MIHDRLKSLEYIELRDDIDIIHNNVQEIVPYINVRTDDIELLNNSINTVRDSIIELHPVLSSFREEFDDTYVYRRKFTRDINLLAYEHFNVLNQLKIKDSQIKNLNIAVICLASTFVLSCIYNFLHKG